MVYSLLGFFFGMIAVFAAAVGTVLGLSNFSTGVGHYPRSIVERDIAATSREPHLFMVVPDTKDGSPAKNTKDGSPAKNMEAATAPAEKPDANKSKPHKPKLLTSNNNEQPGYGHAVGYAQETRNGPRGLFFNW